MPDISVSSHSLSVYKLIQLAVIQGFHCVLGEVKILDSQGKCCVYLPSASDAVCQVGIIISDKILLEGPGIVSCIVYCGFGRKLGYKLVVFNLFKSGKIVSGDYIVIFNLLLLFFPDFLPFLMAVLLGVVEFCLGVYLFVSRRSLGYTSLRSR